LRILHLRNSHLVGGPERLLLDQATRAAPGFEPTCASFVTRGEKSEFLAAARAAGLPGVAVEQAGSYDPRVPGRVRRHLREQDYDVVVGHDYKANLVLALARRGLRARHCAVVHGWTGETARVRLFEVLERRALRRADAVVVVSRAAADRLAAAGVPRARLHLVPNGIDAARVAREAAAGRARLRKEWGYTTDDVVVATMGRLSPEKNQALLVEAFADLPRSARLLVVGDGPARRAVEEAVLRTGTTGRVRLAGWRADPAACLGAADVLVLPSLTEGLPLALLEAMAAGLPVVATRVGGVPDLLADGAQGVLVPPGDAAALRAALEPLVADPERRAELGRRGRARVQEAYDVERQVRALEVVYRSLA